MSAVNGSTMLSGCAYVADWNTTDCASPTAAWAKAAGVQLRRLLLAADSAIPGAVAGVQLAGLSTGEWELPHDDFVATNGTFRWFPGYSQSLAKEWCARRSEAAGCHVPTAAERNAPTVGNSFVTASNSSNSSSSSGGARAIAFARFSAMTVARTLATLCDAAKDASGGRIFTFAFYGYIINSATNIQFAGHAAAEFLLSQPSVDGISSPTLYAPSARSPVGAVITHGPWNTPAMHNKIWVVEADLRTVLAAESDLRMYGYGVDSLNSTCDVLTKYVFAAAMHGNAMYFYDLANYGWYGRASNRTAGAAIWKCIGRARDAAQRQLTPAAGGGAASPHHHHHQDSAVASASAVPQGVTAQTSAEVFLFLDEVSALHWPVSGPLDTHDATKAWVQYLMQQPAELLAPAIGTPLRVHLLSDLLKGELTLRHAKLAIFANAYRVDAALHAAVQQKLHASGAQPTLVFFHAPGAIDGSGRWDAAGPGRLLQTNGMRLGAGARRLDTYFVDSSSSSSSSGSRGAVPDFSSLRGRLFSSLLGGLPPVASHAPVSPWFSCSGDAAHCSVLGRSNGSTALTAVASDGTLCWCDFGSHRTLYSASPGLPFVAWQAVLRSAGVHVWAAAGGYAGTHATSTSAPGAGEAPPPDLQILAPGAFFDACEVSASVSLGLVRVAPRPNRSAHELGLIELPRMARHVTDAVTGVLMCANCSRFSDPRVSNRTQAYRFEWA